MSTFIQLTALKRNDRNFTKSILVDVNKIVNPIIENESGNSIIEVDTDISYGEEFFNNLEKYIVSEGLDAIAALTDEVFKGTIVSQNDRPALVDEALFVKSRIVGTVREVAPGEESRFDYMVMSQKSPDRYVVQESLAIINS